MSGDQVVKHNFNKSETRLPSCVLVTGNGACETETAIVTVHLARRSEFSGGHRLADTSFLQLSVCRAIVLDGTKRLQDMFLRKTVSDGPKSR